MSIRDRERDIVYFDLETQRSRDEVGGWANASRMGMSIGVTYSTKLGEYRIYGENDVHALIDQLTGASMVVGFNHIRFDYSVLEGYTILSMADQTVNLDLLLDIQARIGRFIGLGDVATATLGLGKTADGMEALRWWREGKIREIARYCAYDVKVTMRVHEFGKKMGYIQYRDQAGQPVRLPVDW